MRPRAARVLITVCVLAAPALAPAGDGGWVLRSSVLSVGPNESSSTLAGSGGTGETVVDDVIPELDLTYMLNQRWGLEVTAGTSNHKLATVGGALGGSDAGAIGVLPPTVTLQYHLGYRRPVDLYLGVGVDFPLDYDHELSDDLAGLGIRDLDFEACFGLSGQIGADIALGGDGVLNLNVKYVDMTTDVDLVLGDGDFLDTLYVELDPSVAGVAVGYRF